jgi:hypothetical protein
MKLKKIMKEEFKEWEGDRLGNKAPIYKNPTLKEIRGLKKEMDGNDVRLLIDTKKNNVFLFPSLLLHIDAARALKIKPQDRKTRYLEVLGKIEGDSIIIDKSFVNKNLDWLKKYKIWFNNPFLNTNAF